MRAHAAALRAAAAQTGGRRTSPEHEPALHLLALRIDPDASQPELLALFRYADVDRPLTCDHRIPFFTRAELGDLAIERAGLRARFPDPAPRDVALTCDIATALYLIVNGDADGCIIDCLNTVFDMVAATDLPFPEDHRAELHALADHTTFERDLIACFDGDASRIDAFDALLWCVGAITFRATVIG